MFLLPSYNRPHNLMRFFNACWATDTITPGLVLVDLDDWGKNCEAYSAIELPMGWTWFKTKARSQGDKIREVWPGIEGVYGWFGLLGDDCVPLTKGWNSLLLEKLDPWSIVSCNDSWQAPKRLGNCWIMGGDLVRAMGGIFPGKLQHLFVDDIWEHVGRECGNWECRMDVMVRHAHVLKGEAPADETHRKVYGIAGDRTDGDWPGDAAEYKRWLAEDAEAVIDTVRANRPAPAAPIQNVQRSFTGMWLVPAHNPATLPPFFAACAKTVMQTPALVLVQKDQIEEFSALTLPPGWAIWTTDAESNAGKVQEVFASGQIESWNWLGVMSPELIPQTDHWDAQLITRVTDCTIVAANDGWQAPKHIQSAVVFGMPLLRAVGYFAPEGVGDNWIWDLWEHIGRDTGCVTWAMDVVLRKPSLREPGKLSTDSEIPFRRWGTAGRSKARDAVVDLAQSCGVRVTKPDLTGVRIMLAVPSHDGKYESVFVRSKDATADAITAAGGEMRFAEVSYCADIGLARARLLGTFLRSECTHMWAVDADMGWEAVDLLRMADLKVDFAAAAGPKKQYPIRYAFETDGKPMRVGPDGVSFEIPRVGMAFCLITRAVVEKMIAAYPELAFRTDGGAVDYGLFDPVYADMRRMSEDYSFCDRWTKLGGKIYMLPQIRLRHVGAHTFEGCLMDEIAAQAGRQVA